MGIEKKTPGRDWTLPSSSGMHLEFMDGLRGIAILMVIASHAFYYNPNGPKVFIVAGKFFGAGIMGVPIFFALSGFLISFPFFKARLQQPGHWYPSGYAVRRALKVFPPFWLTVCLLCVFYYARHQDVTYLVTGLGWAAGLANFFHFTTYFNTSFWSLWVEVHFYLLLPFLFWLLSGKGIRATGWGIFAILVLSAEAGRYLNWDASASYQEIHFLMRRFPAALDGFAWGVLFAAYFVSMELELPRFKRLGKIGYLGLLAILCSMLLFAWCDYRWEMDRSPTRWWFEFTRVAPAIAAGLAMFFVFDPTLAGARFLSTRALTFIGLVSYEWFLIHQPVFFYCRELAGSSQGSLVRYSLIVLVPVLVTLLAAVLMYRYFSLPLMRRGRAYFLGK